MRPFLATLSSAFGGIIALLIFALCLGFLDEFLTLGDPSMLLYATMIGALTGILKFTMGIETNKLFPILGISFAIAVAVFLMIAIILNFQGVQLVYSSYDLMVMVYMTLVFVFAFGLLPGLCYYGVIRTAGKKTEAS